MPETTTTTTGEPRDAAPRRRLDAASWVPALVVLALLSLAAAGYGLTRTTSAGAATAPPGTITVSGTGMIDGTPDTVQFTIGIHTVRATAVTALRANESQLAGLEQTFAARGVLKKQMQTTNVSIYEQTNNNGVFTGFAVDDQLQVTVHNVARAGHVIDAGIAVVGAGVEFNGVSFSLSNESQLLTSARARAMQNALTVARQLAAAGGETVGAIQKVTDQESTAQPVYAGSFGEALNAYAAPHVPLEAGQQPVSVHVTVTYQLNS